MERKDPGKRQRDLRVYSGYLCEFIRALRQKRGLSQHKVSLDGGLGREAVGRIERGETDPTHRTLLAVARGLRLTPERFFRLYGLFLFSREWDDWHLRGQYYSEDGSERLQLWKREPKPQK